MAANGEKIYRNFEPMIYAQNDIYMAHNDVTDIEFNSILSDVKKGKIKRALLQRNAMNICKYLMNSNAMNRLHDVNLNSIEVIPENKTAPYSCAIEAQIPTTDGGYFTVTDYASTGKLWTEESKMAVWFNTKERF
jgi:hypothetical protein